MLLKSNFPPARPSDNNLKAICLYGNGRPRYPAARFPSSSYAYARRAGKAVNRLEAWFSQCCYGGFTYGNRQILCCAEQAVSTQNEKHMSFYFSNSEQKNNCLFPLFLQWKAALSRFCIEEYSTMTLVHECCEKKGEERWNCIKSRAPNPFYQPLSGYRAPIIPPDRILTWNPNTC